MRVVVPAYDAADHTMLWFDSAALRDQSVRNHWRSLTGKPPLLDPPVWQVAAATAAAPTYFDPVRAGGRVWLDGGLGANNPTPVAMALAHADLSQSRTDLSPEDRLRSIHSFPKIWVLSIGTGRTPPNSRWRRGRLGFALGLPHAFMYPSALTAEFAVQSMADIQEVTASNQFGRVFAVLRVDPPESMAQLPLDAATPAAFDEMERAADEALGDTSFIIDFAMFAAASRL
jgi:patatin-like phospholipase/acyl hydrolase